MGEVALAFLSGFEWDEQKQMCVACPLGKLYDHKVLQKNPPNSNICAKKVFCLRLKDMPVCYVW